MRRRSFWFHYNKPASAKAGAPRLTVHWKGQCLIVPDVKVFVPVASRHRKTQPRCVIAGKAESVSVENGTAIIT